MKKRTGLILVIVAVLAFATGAIAKNTYEIIKAQIRTDFIIEIDGEEKEFRNANGERVYPVLYDGTTYLPVRAIGEIMGKKVYWYEDDKRIELKDEKKSQSPTVTDADVIVQEGKKSDTKPDKVGYISEDKAKRIALEKAGISEKEADFIKVEFEKDDGIYIYEVEIKKGLFEYNADIKADDGTILEWDAETEY